METAKIIRASLTPIVISLILSIFGIGLEILTIFTSGEYLDSVRKIQLGYSYLLIPIFIYLYIWTGKRAVKRYNLNNNAAAAASAIAYAAGGFIGIILNVIIGMMALGGQLNIRTFKPTEAVLATAILGDTSGFTGILYSALCGVGMISIGILISYTLGLIGSNMQPQKINKK
ncbi:hypothetical protein HY990_01630 [Candidatus Micrarchaeota archaeon]|nr:hypothetical protein [Candidatus Micrarchaeota archaeon]